MTTKTNNDKAPEIPLPDTYLYTLAHHVVRGLFFSDPREFCHLADREWDLGFADYIWDHTLQFAAPGADWSAQRGDFTARRVVVKGRPAILIGFPAPPEQTLCHMALAVMSRGRSVVRGQGRPRYGRYFTLERGRRKRDTVLCEWTGKDCHIYHSAGPVPGGEAFIQAVEAQIYQSKRGGKNNMKGVV